MQKLVSAKTLVEQLEKGKAKGYLSTVKKINEGIEKHKNVKEVLVIAIDLSDKKVNVNGQKTFETEVPVKDSYEEAYKSIIESLVLTTKKDVDLVRLKESLLSQEILTKLKNEKQFVISDKKPFLEVLIEDTRYMEMGNITIDFAI